MTLRVNAAKGEVDLRFKNQRLLTYAFAADQVKPYVKSLYTLQGTDVLQDAPPDHLHHHGIMYAIRVNGVNFWEERGDPGHERSIKILSHETGRNADGLPQATFTQLIHWVTHTNATLADTAPVALLIERRTITVTVDEARQEVALDWRGDFEVGSAPVKLTGSDYNGLGLRLPQPFDHVARHENSENTPYTGKGQRGVTSAKWSKVSHTVDGRKITVTLFDRPGNAGGQARFFTMLDPFAYLAVTQGLDKAPQEYPAGAKFSVNYRLTVRTENPSAALDESTYYRMETLPIPAHVKLEVGGMAFMPDRRLMIGTRRGEVWSLRDGQWKRFASGLDEAMGVCPISNNQIVVAQRPELTRITDTDGDGVADLYETLSDDWQYSGHIYEWTFGPVRDKEGNFYGTLACWFYSTKEYDKPPYSGWKMPIPVGYKPGPETAWRGWSFKITPEGKFIPWSVGLRSPNGLGLSPAGDLFVSDNQGEYFGSSVLHHVTQGAFHGHPNGFFWGPEAVSDPFAIPLDELDKRRKLAAIQLPYGIMGQSASEPVWDTTGGKFGPFAGQMFIGDQTKSTVMRVQLEKVDGEFQGACFPFRSGFQCGNNRQLFEPSGSLLVGQTDRGWGAVGGQPYGLQRLVWTGAVPMEIQTMQLTREGFDLTFTKPVDPATASKPEAYSLERYHYHYHRTYGSPQVDRTPVPIAGVRVSNDRKKVSLLVKDLVPRKIYELHLSGMKAADGSEVLHPAAYYTLNRLQPAAVARRAGS